MSKEYLNPAVTADIVISFQDKGIVLVKRKNEPFKDSWALPGGHLNVTRESVLEAAVREAKEETNLEVNPADLTLLGVYSDPLRDPRGHYVSVAYYTTIHQGELRAMDDAKEIGVFTVENLPGDLAFDHQKIIDDYLRRFQ